jgi:hypothetical protein
MIIMFNNNDSFNIPHWGNSCRPKRSAMMSWLGFEPLTLRSRGRRSTTSYPARQSFDCSSKCLHWNQHVKTKMATLPVVMTFEFMGLIWMSPMTPFPYVYLKQEFRQLHTEIKMCPVHWYSIHMEHLTHAKSFPDNSNHYLMNAN